MRIAPLSQMRKLKQLKLEYCNIFNACYDGNLVAVKTLIEEGAAKVTDRDNQRDTPLSIAAWKGHATIVKYLLSQKSDLESEDKVGRRPLHLAASGGSFEVVQLLTEAGATLEVYDDIGMSPLHYAARQGSAVTTGYLYKKRALGASPVTGKTPWGLAMDEGHVGALRALGSHHAHWTDWNTSTNTFDKLSERHYTLLFKAGLIPGAFDCPRSIFLELGSSSFFFCCWSSHSCFLRQSPSSLSLFIHNNCCFCLLQEKKTQRVRFTKIFFR
jgi:ankyrin repeat protein